MRKAWYILLAFLIVGLISFSTSHFVIDGSQDAVTWEEETIFGDKGAVEGVRVKTMNHMTHHLLWETEGALGSELHPETKFTFSNESIHTEMEITFRGLDMYANTDFLAGLAFNDNTNMPEYAQKKYADLIAYCAACFESVSIGEEKEFTVDLGKYMDYYSFSGYLDIPGPTQVINEFDDRWTGTPDALIQAIHDFFRIPILGEFKVIYSINRRQNGGSFGASYAGGPDGEVYTPQFDSIYMNDKCYLTFNAVAENGEVVDTSLIPGGYGLYRVNVRSDSNGAIVWDTPIADMVYAMDPGEEFSYLEKSDDEKHIYIHTWQGNKLMRTILDESTMEVLQKFALYERTDFQKYEQYEVIGDYYWEVKQYDDFLAVLKYSINNVKSETNTVTVFAEDEQGLYHHQFTVPMSPEEVDVNDDLRIFSSVTANLDYDGEKLYVIQNEYSDYKHGYARGDSCNFFVLAYGPEGIAYIGKYHVNLSQINLDEEYWSSSVQPWYDNPVTFIN